MLLLAPALALGGVVAAASPVLLRVTSPQPPLEAPVDLHAAGASWRLRDDGRAPDPRVGDGVWTGVVASTPGAAVSLQLTDGAGRAWAGDLVWPSGGTAELDLALTDAGELVASAAPVEGSAPAGAATAFSAPAGAATVPRTVSGSWAWAVAALGWGLALSGVLRRVRRAPRRISSASSPLGAHRYTVSSGEAAAALALLAREHRVVVVGPPPTAPPGAVVFAPDSPEPGDLAAALRDLDGRGRPLAVLVVLPDLDGAPGLTTAAAGLPMIIATDAVVPGARPLSLG